jgi:drug/metabolite transporter (DMT)-like permease
VTGFALILILVAAVFHASWNMLAKRAGGGAAFVWLYGIAATIIYLPFAIGVIVYQQPEIGFLGYVFIVGSAILHLAYFLFLQQGYRKGDLSVVYPLARGTGPTLSTIAAIIFLGERPTPIALAGALLVIFGVFLLTGGTKLFRTKDAGPAIYFGLITGVTIAGYTLWDKYAVSILLVPPLLLDYGSNVGRTILLAPYAYRHWDEVRAEWQAHRMEAIGVASLSSLSYILVLTAMTFTPVSYVAPAREVSILIGAMLGARLLKEGDTRRRLAAASVIVTGLVFLALN